MFNKGPPIWEVVKKYAGGIVPRREVRCEPKSESSYRAAVAMQPARTKTATASKVVAQSVVIMMGSFRSDGTRVARRPQAFLDFDETIMTAPTYTAVARVLRFCRLGAGLGEEGVGVEVFP